ncbi:MAG: response regulator [Gemmatimonadetes bacterium]|nr:response regulator [Gemmatimonadota bacterium]
MKKILIVEDDKAIAMTLGTRVRAAGYTVINAFDAIGGVSMAQRETPDLILLDLMMPAGGGLRVAERVRALPKTSSTPIIFLTASKDPAMRDEAMTHSPVAFLEKPYDAAELLTHIQDALGVTA